MIIDRLCAENRKVKECEECYRYKYCMTGTEPPLINDKECINIGIMVVSDVVQDYEKSWRKGWKNQLDFCHRWLEGQRCNLLTAETYDGQAILSHLVIRCKKKYGDFNVIYERRQERLKKKMKVLKEQLLLADTNEERKKLKLQIRELNGEMNK